MKRIFAVGIGPGALEQMTPYAAKILADSSVIAGYEPYLRLVSPLLEGKRVISGGMRQERERCVGAMEACLAGEKTAVISSGDAGVYGMAGLLMELAESERFSEIDVEVVPGITAALSCAALAGAPFMNDFVVLSLSDLMTPGGLIRKRLDAAAGADLPAALYNPASKKRRDLLEYAVNVFRARGGGDLPCAVVRDAYRPGQSVRTFPISEFPFEAVQMTTLVILGNSRTVLRNGKLYCRRGYREKYGEL